MTPTSVDRLVEDYLRRLDASAAVLPPDRRAELVAEISEHIQAARAAGSAADEAAVRTLLDRLGAPEEIVAAAVEGEPPPRYPATSGPAVGWAPPPPAPTGTALELAAVLLLTLGSIVPVLGWLAGVLCLWLSKRWTVGEKLVGTFVVPFGPAVAIPVAGLGVLAVARTCTSSSTAGGDPVTSCSGPAGAGWVAGILIVVLVVAPVVVAVWLYRRATRRAAAGIVV